MFKKSNKPNTFILGATKSGTTALYDILNSHPEIYFPIIKEPQFFSNDDLYEKGIESYISNHFNKSGRYKCRVDATPHYLYYEKVAQRIQQEIGTEHVQFIVILREPVSRAYSLYWNMVREGCEILGFEAALEKEKERLMDKEQTRLGAVRYQYLSSGMYSQQLERYFKYFDRKQFLILFQSDLRERPESVINSITNFLNVKELPHQEEQRSSNLSSMPRFRWVHDFLRGKSFLKKIVGGILPYNIKYLIVTKLISFNLRVEKYPPLDKQLAKKIKLHFTEDINLLEQITGRNLDDWR